MPHNAIKLLVEAADAGLHITGLDGWTQTRLAKTLQIRRETLNAIINRSPGSEPTDERPRMVEACQKLLTFAAALSAKDDAVLKNPIDVANLQSDDGQAYEHHRLRLHRLVEEAVEGNQFTNALCRLGEFASAAMHAADGYRLRMICNLMTAIQRLLDKPASREVPAAVLRANLSRLYRAERMCRRIGRERAMDKSIREPLDYVRGQAGYAFIFSGILLAEPRLVRRGGRRLFRAIDLQPAPCCGHWSNLLRATNDLLAGFPNEAQAWAKQIVRFAETQPGNGFATAYLALRAKDEIQRLRAYWNQSDEKSVIDRLLKAAPAKDPQGIAAGYTQIAKGAVALILLSLAAWVTCPAFAGDGRDFKSSQSDPVNVPRAQSQPVQSTTTLTPRMQNSAQAATAAGKFATVPGSPRDSANSTRGFTRLGGFGRFGIDNISADSRSNRDIDSRDWGVAIASSNADVEINPDRLARTIADVWGDNIKAYGQIASPSAKTNVMPKPAPEKGVQEAVARPTPMLTPKSATATRDLAIKAEKALGMARNYLSTGDETIARQKLKEIVKTYPETPSAQEAQALLQQLASN